MKKKFGSEAAKKMAQFRATHLDAYKYAIEESKIPNLASFCQMRDVEMVEASMHPKTWEGRKKKFNAWRDDFPDEAEDWTVYGGIEASEVMFRMLSLQPDY